MMRLALDEDMQVWADAMDDNSVWQGNSNEKRKYMGDF